MKLRARSLECRQASPRSARDNAVVLRMLEQARAAGFVLIDLKECDLQTADVVMREADKQMSQRRLDAALRDH